MTSESGEIVGVVGARCGDEPILLVAMNIEEYNDFLKTKIQWIREDEYNSGFYEGCKDNENVDDDSTSHEVD